MKSPSVKTKGDLEPIPVWSGRRDLNSGPHGPEPCALAGLSHAPNAWDYNLANTLWQVQGINRFIYPRTPGR